MIKIKKLQKKKGFTLVELLVVVAILAILSVSLLPSILGYSDNARDTRTAKDIRNFNTVVEAFASADGNYPEASLDTDNPRSIASVMQSKGINWTGDENGVVDSWGNPYYYDIVGDYYCIGSSGKDGTLNTSDDICNIGGKVSKKASGLDGNAIPSAVPGNNPGNGNEEHLSEVPDGYIGIYTPGELASIGNDPDYPLDGNYIVMKDLDLSGYDNWTPIGVEDWSAFNGIFDGNNYIISNLTINEDSRCLGLFGWVGAWAGSNAEIRNVILADAEVTAADTSGILIGSAFGGGTITNCNVSGTLNGEGYLGGLAGDANGSIISSCIADCYINSTGGHVGGLVGVSQDSTISSCHTTGSVKGEDWGIGGLVGQNNGGEISNSYSTVSVVGTHEGIGGLIGSNVDGSISNCYSAGNVQGNAQSGGLIGENRGNLSYSYAIGNVDGNGADVGGLLGYNVGEVSHCHATGNVTNIGSGSTGGLIGTSDNSVSYSHSEGFVEGAALTGGLIGCNTSNLSYSYATGNVNGSGDLVGGLVGNNGGIVLCSYATGDVNGQGFCTGGLIGCNGEDVLYSYSVGLVTSPNSDEGMPTGGLLGANSGDITSCYYDQTTSGQSDDIGNGTPLTTAQMKDQANFIGWDFILTWDTDNSYPFLLDNEQIPHPGI